MNSGRISQRDFFSSVGLVLLSTVCLAVAASLWKYFTTVSSLGVVVFVRFFAPLVLLGVWALVRRLRLQVDSVWPHLLRAVVVLGGQYCLLFVLSRTNLLLATLLYSTSGLFAPILMFLFLRVRASTKAIVSIVISFVGVAVALGVGGNLIAPISLIGLLSGLLTAAGQIIQHRMTKSENIVVINLVLFGLCSLFAFFLLLVMGEGHLSVFDHFSVGVVGVVVAFAVLTIANQTLKNAAFRYVKKATTLAPFLYATIIFSGLIDWLWYDIVPQLHTIIGVALIIAGGVIMSVRKV